MPGELTARILRCRRERTQDVRSDDQVVPGAGELVERKEAARFGLGGEAVRGVELTQVSIVQEEAGWIEIASVVVIVGTGVAGIEKEAKRVAPGQVALQLGVDERLEIVVAAALRAARDAVVGEASVTEGEIDAIARDRGRSPGVGHDNGAADV